MNRQQAAMLKFFDELGEIIRLTTEAIRLQSENGIRFLQSSLRSLYSSFIAMILCNKFLFYSPAMLF